MRMDGWILSYPDHAVSLFEAEQQASILGESATNAGQLGKAGRVAQLLGRDVALAPTSGASPSPRKMHHISASSTEKPHPLLHLE